MPTRPSRDTHPCAAPGCDRRCSLQYLMCRPHWMQVPRPLREAIYATVGERGDLYAANVREAQRVVGERIAARRAAENGRDG